MRLWLSYRDIFFESKLRSIKAMLMSRDGALTRRLPPEDVLHSLTPIDTDTSDALSAIINGTIFLGRGRLLGSDSVSTKHAYSHYAHQVEVHLR